jgi:hypothetical protein
MQKKGELRLAFRVRSPSDVARVSARAVWLATHQCARTQGVAPESIRTPVPQITVALIHLWQTANCQERSGGPPWQSQGLQPKCFRFL